MLECGFEHLKLNPPLFSSSSYLKAGVGTTAPNLDASTMVRTAL